MPLYGMRRHCAAWKLQGKFDFFAVQFRRYPSEYRIPVAYCFGIFDLPKRKISPSAMTEKVPIRQKRIGKSIPFVVAVYLVNSGIDVVGIVQIGPQRAGTLT